MKLLEPLADELRLLTGALDEGAGIAGALARVWADARATVPSFCGLTVSVPGSDAPFTFTALVARAGADEVRASLLVPYSPARADNAAGVTIILYARTPGAFVDVSADLAWLSGRDMGDYVVDQHLDVPRGENRTAVADGAVINQAVGVLLGRGYPVGEASAFLDAQAERGVDRHAAAQAVLDSLDGLDSPEGFDSADLDWSEDADGAA